MRWRPGSRDFILAFATGYIDRSFRSSQNFAASSAVSSLPLLRDQRCIRNEAGARCAPDGIHVADVWNSDIIDFGAAYGVARQEKCHPVLHDRSCH